MPEECKYSDHWRTRAEDRSRNAEDQEFRPQVAERDQRDSLFDGLESRNEDRRARQCRTRTDFECPVARVRVRTGRPAVKNQVSRVSGFQGFKVGKHTGKGTALAVPAPSNKKLAALAAEFLVFD